MKMGYFLRKLSTKVIGVIRQLREMKGYFKEYHFENSFRKGKADKLKSLLVVQEGALGDTYNFIGILNQIAEDYPKMKIYCLTREKTKSFYKNPRVKVITSKEAEDLILKNKINGLVAYGSLDNFFEDKRIVFKIKYRAGRKLPWKTRKVPDEILPIFKKLGFKVEGPKFYFTKEGEETAKRFYNDIDFRMFVVMIQVGSGKTIRALKENKVPSHLWNPENWAQVADYLIDHKRAVIFTGVEEEKPMVQEVMKVMKNKQFVIDISGKYSVEEVASIASRADFVVGIDSGIIHILSQIGIPVVILFAGDPRISAPHSNSINIWNSKVCNGCRKYFCPEQNAICINSISVKDVLEHLPIDVKEVIKNLPLTK